MAVLGKLFSKMKFLFPIFGIGQNGQISKPYMASLKSAT
jgi:hypothetical protein